MSTRTRPDTLKIEPGKTSWRHVFHRSRMSPYIFVVNRVYVPQVRAVVNGLELPTWSSINMFDNCYWVTPLLDGLVQLLDAYGLPPVPSGFRVFGHRPLRLLCCLLRLRPPSRLLAGESVIPTPEELLAELAAQRVMPEDCLAAQVRLGIGTGDTRSMQWTVEQLFGPVHTADQK